jgi:hypothetical protein
MSLPQQTDPTLPQLTAGDICKDALMELGVYSQSDPVSADDMSFCLRKLNSLLDLWDAKKTYSWNVNFQTFRLVPNLQPHSIGVAAQSPDPNPTFVVTVNRPVKIESAQVILDNVSPAVFQPLNIRDDAWWADQRIPGLSTSFPTDLYYSPDWPNGNCYFWPIPTTAWGIRLEIWVPLAGLPIARTIFTFPPGYQEAITLTLAENISPAFEKQPSLITVRNAMKARGIIQITNSNPPTMGTCDSGIPNGQRNGNRATFNYRTGMGR